MLEFVSDGDSDLGRVGAIRLEAQVADDALRPERTAVQDRDEAFSVVVVSDCGPDCAWPSDEVIAKNRVRRLSGDSSA